ncbi:hypothetical protein TNCV_2350651 [Trichonephila clavipes]|uniref:Uncharacterized protein n=1 Tax=Trichonephila clavipes TaxID=2585209 RepID=A0A8X6SW17_TRICX|nr:hypothetical protein TNCV_2350651 [Trichonephila clavipes]
MVTDEPFEDGQELRTCLLTKVGRADSGDGLIPPIISTDIQFTNVSEAYFAFLQQSRCYSLSGGNQLMALLARNWVCDMTRYAKIGKCYHFAENISLLLPSLFMIVSYLHFFSLIRQIGMPSILFNFVTKAHMAFRYLLYDGSKIDRRVGFGVVVFRSGVESEHFQFRICDECTVFVAELLCLNFAIKWITEQNNVILEYHICTDSFLFGFC